MKAPLKSMTRFVSFAWVAGFSLLVNTYASDLPRELSSEKEQNMTQTSTATIISHRTELPDFESKVKDTLERIQARGDLPHATVAEQLQILSELSDSSFAKRVFLHGGVTGSMTREMCLHPKLPVKSSLPTLDDCLLNQAPSILATQERYQIFQNLLQAEIREEVVMASCPCGLMDDLLTLDFQEVQNYKLVGIDLDADSLDSASLNAIMTQQLSHSEFAQLDAWNLDYENTFDVITSNGLNIYEPSAERVTQLYEIFFRALKPGGVLITSFLTPPPALDKQSPWDMANIDQENLRKQRIFFADIAQAGFQNYRSYTETEAQLLKAGFHEITFHDDKAKIFPTVKARKEL